MIYNKMGHLKCQIDKSTSVFIRNNLRQIINQMVFVRKSDDSFAL